MRAKAHLGKGALRPHDDDDDDDGDDDDDDDDDMYTMLIGCLNVEKFNLKRD